MPSVTKQRQLDLVSSRIELTGGGRYSTRKLGSDIRNLQKLVGTKAQRRAIGQAVTDKAVAKVQGAGKYNTKKSHPTCVMFNRSLEANHNAEL